MSRRAVLFAIAGAALVILLAAALWWSGRRRPQATGDEIFETEEIALPEETVAVELYFPGQGNRLHGEERLLPATASVEERVRRLAEEVLRGPTGGGLSAPLPAGVSVAGVHVDADAVALLDLTPAEGGERLAWGSRKELLAVYSLVDSILLNVPEVERVALLWSSQQRPTFAGHVDTTRPLGANASLIASRAP